MKIGDRVFVVDKTSGYFLNKGVIIAEYDTSEFKREFTVKIKIPGIKPRSAHAYKKIGVNRNQLRLIDGSLPYSSRGDLWRAIENGRIKGAEIINVFSALRDAGVVEINLPSN
jgi:hypothetical protein